MPQTLPQWVVDHLADYERRLKALERTPRLTNSSIDDGSINVKDEDERVREIIGLQPDGSHGSRVVLSPAQPTPTAPAVTVGERGSAEAVWDGKTTDVEVPLVHGRVDVIAALMTGDLEPAPADGHVVASIRDRDGGATPIALPAAGTWYVWFRMVGQDRITVGAFSEPATAEVVALRDTEAIAEVIAEAQQRINASTAAWQHAKAELEQALAGLNSENLPGLAEKLTENDQRVQDARNRLESVETEIRVNVDALAARIATVIELNAETITAGLLGVARLNVAEFFGDEGVLNRLRAAVVEAIDITAETGFIGGALLKDNTIDVGKINVTEELTAAVANFLEVNAGMIAANAIDGMVITAGTFQTQHEAQRGVKLQPSGLKGWGTDGTLNFDLDTSGHLTAQEASIEGRFQAGTGLNRVEIDQGDVTYYSSATNSNRTITNVPYIKMSTPDVGGNTSTPVIAARPEGGIVIASGPSEARSVVDIDGFVVAQGGQMQAHLETTSVYASIGITGIGTNMSQAGGLVATGTRTRLQGRTANSESPRDMYVHGESTSFTLVGSDSIVRMNFTYGAPPPQGDRVPQVTATCQLTDNTSGRIAALTVGNISADGFQCTARPVGGGSSISYNMTYQARWR